LEKNEKFSKEHQETLKIPRKLLRLSRKVQQFPEKKNKNTIKLKQNIPMKILEKLKNPRILLQLAKK